MIINRSISLQNEDQLLEMATLGEVQKYVIVVFTNDSGNIPHYHYMDKSTRGQEFHTCIKLESAEYFHHTGKEDVLNSAQRKKLVEFLESPHHRYKEETNWQHLLYLWNNENNSSKKVDEDLKMPNYVELNP